MFRNYHYQKNFLSIFKDYSEYYKGRAYHSRSLNSNGRWKKIGCMSFINQSILKYSNEIRSAVFSYTIYIIKKLV